MKNAYKVFCVVGFVFFSVITTLGQTYVETDEVNTNNPETVTQLFQGLGIDTSVNPRSATLEGSSVFVRQIGEINRVKFSVISTANDINVIQNGNNNLTDLTYNVKTAIANIAQNGDFNTVRDFVLNPAEDVSLELTQQGNGIYFERFGSNSITRSLKFNQTEASPTIIVRSFN